MKKQTTGTRFLLLSLIAQMGLTQYAQAESASSWGEWDSDAQRNNPTQVGFNYQPNVAQPNADQVRIAINNGQLLTKNTSSTPEYVGYGLCTRGCTNTVNINNGIYTSATDALVINTTLGNPISFDENTYGYDYNGVPAYGKQGYTYYEGSLKIVGTLDSKPFALNLNSTSGQTGDLSINQYGQVDSYSPDYSNPFYNFKSNLYYDAWDREVVGADVNILQDGPFGEGRYYQDGDTYTRGQFYFGKPLVATQIAEQMRLGQTYSYSGGSYYGSQVQINVNFSNASWNGTWNPVQTYGFNGFSWTPNAIHNGFTAQGTVSGANLSSTSLSGTGSSSAIGYVNSGNVNGTLVGAITGTDASGSAIVGQYNINVKQTNGNVNMGDIFRATSNDLRIR